MQRQQMEAKGNTTHDQKKNKARLARGHNPRKTQTTKSITRIILSIYMKWYQNLWTIDI